MDPKLKKTCLELLELIDYLQLPESEWPLEEINRDQAEARIANFLGLDPKDPQLLEKAREKINEILAGELKVESVPKNLDELVEEYEEHLEELRIEREKLLKRTYPTLDEQVRNALQMKYANDLLGQLKESEKQLLAEERILTQNPRRAERVSQQIVDELAPILPQTARIEAFSEEEYRKILEKLRPKIKQLLERVGVAQSEKVAQIFIDQAAKEDLPLAQEVAATPRSYDVLETHRFRISKESSEKLNLLKKNLVETSTRRPEVVGMTVFGSQTKGWARPESDIDAYFFVDANLAGIKENEESKTRVYPLRGDGVWEQINKSRGQEFRAKLGKSLGLSEEQLKDIRLRLLSKSRIDLELRDLIEYGKEIIVYEDRFEKMMKDPRHAPRPGPYPEIPEHIALDKLFHLQIGKGLDDYRAYILQNLEQEGEVGEKAWKLLIERIEMMERDLRVTEDEKLFPQTIQSAIKRFGLEYVQPKYKVISTRRLSTRFMRFATRDRYSSVSQFLGAIYKKTLGPIVTTLAKTSLGKAVKSIIAAGAAAIPGVGTAVSLAITAAIEVGGKILGKVWDTIKSIIRDPEKSIAFILGGGALIAFFPSSVFLVVLGGASIATGGLGLLSWGAASAGAAASGLAAKTVAFFTAVATLPITAPIALFTVAIISTIATITFFIVMTTAGAFILPVGPAEIIEEFPPPPAPPDIPAPPGLTFRWPVDTPYTCSSNFGYRVLRGKCDYHEGIDIPAGWNEPAYATAKGKVYDAGNNPGYGNYVVVKHDGLFSFYAHLLAVAVFRGDDVDHSSVLGYIDDTGDSDGTHLHFGFSSCGDVPNCFNGKLEPAPDPCNYLSCPSDCGYHDRSSGCPGL